MRLVFARGRAYPPSSMAPQTQYVRSGEVSIAYQVFGQGAFDVVLMLPWESHVNSRGSAGYSSPETRMDDIRAVDGKISGIAVHTGARVAAHARPGEVLVSSTVKDLVAGSGLEFEDRGVHELKGIPGEWRLYAAV
jgi:hypothetical protein